MAALVTAKERADQVQVINTIDAVLTAFQWSPRKSTCSASKELEVQQGTIVKISHKRLGSYRVRVVQALQRNDLLQRAAFGAKILDKIDTDNDYLQRVTFFDEVTFHTRRANKRCQVLEIREFTNCSGTPKK